MERNDGGFGPESDRPVVAPHRVESSRTAVSVGVIGTGSLQAKGMVAMRGFKGLFVCGVALLVSALGLNAQDHGPLSVEVRGAYSLPIGDFGDDAIQGAESDFGFGGDLFLHLTDGFSVYGGWAQDRFDCAVCADDGSYEIAGFEAGAKVRFARDRGAVPWARAGLVASKTTLEDGEVEAESDRKLGFQAAIGLDLPLGDHFALVPALRFQSIGNDFEIDGDDLPIFDGDNVNFFSVDVGLHLYLGR